MFFEEQGEKIAQLAFGDMIGEWFHEETSLLSIVDPAAKTLDETDLNNSEQKPLEKFFSKIGEKIDVPFAARKRIIKICNERGIPGTDILALETISNVWPTNKSNQNKTNGVVRLFSFHTLAIFFYKM